MKLSDQFRTGWRNLRRQKLRSSLTIFAIVIGAVSVTVMLSLVTSAQSFLTTSFEKTGEDRRVIATSLPGLDYRESIWNTWSDGSGVKLTDALVKNFAKIPGVESTTGVIGWGNFESVKYDKIEFTTKNTNFLAYTPNGTIIREFEAGRLLTPDDTSNEVVISTSMANNLGFRGAYDDVIGKTLILTPRKDMGIQNPKPAKVKVVGVILAEGNAMEASLATADALSPKWERCDGPPENPKCETTNEFLRNGYGGIYISVAEKKNIDAVIAEVQKTGVGAAAGKDELETQQTVFKIIGLVLGGIGAIALFVAAIGVINTMVMATLERTREIGIMRAIGATKRSIRRLFTVEAGVLGFLGGVVGVGLSFAVAVLLNSLINKQLEDNGVSVRDVISVPIGLALIVIAVTTGIGMLAGRLPARRAANMDPVEALRYE